MFDNRSWVFKHDRSCRDYGLANPENMGFVPTTMALYRSSDKGRSWSSPQEMAPPLVGPCFELCCPIQILSDGRWIAPTSTWKGWEGDCPGGMRAVNLVSYDQGKTWPEYSDVMNGYSDHIIYWEQKTIELNGGHLLSVAWTHDEKNNKDLENHYAISQDGKTFGEPQPTGLVGQTPTLIHLGNNKILTIYRRMDKTGLWANLSQIDGDQWINLSECSIWTGPEQSIGNSEQDMVEQFQELKFGAPCTAQLDDGTYLVAFWCIENSVSNIRYFKIVVNL